jgi:hypothetical protein
VSLLAQTLGTKMQELMYCTAAESPWHYRALVPNGETVSKVQRSIVIGVRSHQQVRCTPGKAAKELAVLDALLD